MTESPLEPTANKSMLTPTDIRMSNSGWVLGYAPSYVINGTTPPADAPKTIKLPNDPANWRNVKPLAPVQTPAAQPNPTPNLAPPPVLTPQSGAPDPMANLARMAGVDMKTGAAVIQKYLKDGGVGLDPKALAWCAAAMNASLAQVGLPGTGSPAAKSFLNYGNPVTEPQHGDIVVLYRGPRNGEYGHVGYVDRINPDGSVRVLGGNQSQGVNYTNFPADQVAGYRRIPGAVAVTDPSQVKDVASTQLPGQTEAQSGAAPAAAPKTPTEAAGDALQKGLMGANKTEENKKPIQMSPLQPAPALSGQPLMPTKDKIYEELVAKAPTMQGGAARTQPVAATPPVSNPPKEYMQPQREQQNEQQA